MKMYPALTLIACGAVQAVLDTALPLARLWPAWNPFGLVPLLAGFALAAWSAYTFHMHQTTVHPFKPASALVTTGPFAFSRNPIYLGMSLVLLGFAIALGTLSPFVMVPVFMILLTRTIISGEERMLTETFGAEYDMWRGKVRRWF